MRPPLILLLCVAGFAGTFSIGAFPALLPELGSVGGLADWQLGSVAGAFGFARMAADIPVGLFITHHLRRAFLLSPVLLAVGVLTLASGGPFAVLVLGRAAMGVGHALGMVAGLTAVLRFQAPGALASALSAVEFSAMLGMLGGTAAVSLLPGSLPWNGALLLACAPQLVGLLILPLLLRALPPEATGAGRPLFARHGGSAAARPALTLGVALAFVVGGALAITYATLEQFVIPLRGSREFGLDRSGVARLLIVAQLVDIFCLLPAGALADRRGLDRMLGMILILFGVGTALIAFGSLAALVSGTALFGVGMAGWTLPLGLLRRGTAPEHVGWRTALYRVGVDGGIFLGPFLSGLLAGRGQETLTGVLAGALALLGLVLLSGRVRR